MKIINTQLSIVLMFFISIDIQAQNFNRAVKVKENFEAAIPHPEQDKEVANKLADLEKKTGKKPNIVWIVIDDMGYGDPGTYGGGAAIGSATPNMDRLAAEGLKLTSAYSQQTCTPTRSAILTGRLPVRTGLTRPILAGDNITKNPWDDEVSLPKLLSANGYYTLLTGKWHVGEGEGMRPHDVGFDEYYGYYPAQKEITQGIDPRRFPDLVLNEELLKAFETIRPANHLTHGFKDGTTKELEEIKSLEDMGRSDHKLADFTISKIKELSGSDKPFFLSIVL